jgi:hypothetical protein
MNADLFGAFGATFSDCGRYRYSLWRIWDSAKQPAMFLMLNPSTADEVENDPTVERCQRRAMEMGYGGLRVGNIFAFRSTDPNVLYTVEDPIGPDNDAAIIESARESGIVVCGWGQHGNHLKRGEQVLAMLRDAGIRPHALKINQDGTPRHPLYVGYEVLPSAFPT